MAHRIDAHPDNVPGPFFVDRTCIDCGTCYRFAPGIFAASDDHARVHAQPGQPEERLRASMALVACPVGSIGTEDRSEMAAAAAAFPQPLAEQVSFCGYTSDKSFGAWSYLVHRPDGNVLVDSPRAAEPLMKPSGASRCLSSATGTTWPITPPTGPASGANGSCTRPTG